MRVRIVGATGGDAQGALPLDDIAMNAVIHLTEALEDTIMCVFEIHPSGLVMYRVNDGHDDILGKIHVALSEVPSVVVTFLHDRNCGVDGFFKPFHRANAHLFFQCICQLLHVHVHLVEALEATGDGEAVQRQKDAGEVDQQGVVDVRNPVVELVEHVRVFH